jgi:hypothetical protein
LINLANGTEGAIDHGGYVWVQDPNRFGTYVVVGKPTPGTWTLVPTPSTAAIASIGSSLSAPPIAVATRVRRHGRREVLTWRANAVPGQVLEFSEVGARTSTAILTTTKDRGSVTFTPTDDGTDGPRQIEVVVEVGGEPQAILHGATFRPPRPSEPGRPGRVRLVHRGTSVIASWPAVRGASSYEVVINDTNGRRTFFDQPASRRKVVVSPVLAPDRLTASVQTVSAAGLTSPPARATLVLARPPRQPTRRRHPRP